MGSNALSIFSTGLSSVPLPSDRAGKSSLSGSKAAMAVFSSPPAEAGALRRASPSPLRPRRRRLPRRPFSRSRGGRPVSSVVSPLSLSNSAACAGRAISSTGGATGCCLGGRGSPRRPRRSCSLRREAGACREGWRVAGSTASCAGISGSSSDFDPVSRVKKRLKSPPPWTFPGVGGAKPLGGDGGWSGRNSFTAGSIGAAVDCRT